MLKKSERKIHLLDDLLNLLDREEGDEMRPKDIPASEHDPEMVDKMQPESEEALHGEEGEEESDEEESDEEAEIRNALRTALKRKKG